MKRKKLAKYLAVVNDYYFVDYGVGFYSIDYVTESLVDTLMQSDNYQEAKDFFDNLDKTKIPA